MAHTNLASNSLTFTGIEAEVPGSGAALLNVAIFPSSIETGAAVISSGGPVLLNLADVVALRDLLTVCIDQAREV